MSLSVRNAVILLVLATLLAYANSLGGAFVFDDHSSLVSNPTLRDWSRAFSPPAKGITVSGRPVLNFSFALSHHLGGGAVWGHHVVNVLIHGAAALVLFGFVRRTLLLPSVALRFGERALPVAFFIALLWAVHPLQTESVTYLAQRAESQMGLFFLLVFYAYVRGATAALPAVARLSPHRTARPGSGSSPVATEREFAPSTWFALAVAACILGAGTKEVLVVAPVLVLLHDRAFVAGTFRAAWLARRWFYVALFGTWIPLAVLVLGTGGNRGGTSGFDVGITPMSYWLTQFEALTRYLALSFWPSPLVFEYGAFWEHNFAEVAHFAALVIPLGLLTLWLLWRKPQVGFVGGWFFAILAPTSLMPGTLQMIVEHRMYLPLAAVLTAAVLSLYLRLPRLAPWVGVGGAVALGALTLARNADYQSPLRLWRDTLAKRPNSPAAQHGVGIALIADGQPKDAIPLLESAVKLDPGRLDYQANLALAEDAYGLELLKGAKVGEALPHFEQAVTRAPRKVDYRVNQAGALRLAGRTDEAIAQYEEAIRLAPGHADAHSNLGLILGELGRFDVAIAHGDTAIRLAPASPDAHINYGTTLVRAGRPAEAKAQLETALGLDAASPEAHNALGIALINLGRASEATAHFEAALRLRSSYAQARDNLAKLQALLSGAKREP